MNAEKAALIMVDLQNDFCSGGNLAVPNGEAVIPLANQLQLYFDLIIATKDWHPPDHVSFVTNHQGKKVGDTIQTNNVLQVLWPIHCVQYTKGAEFHPQLDTKRIKKITYKGRRSEIDSYSAFFDNAHLQPSTGLATWLYNRHIRNIYMMGLATDYCVQYSSLDAVRLGFTVYVILDACRGVELQPGNIAMAIDNMQRAGVRFVCMQDIMRRY